jgi:hypothetical protein
VGRLTRGGCRARPGRWILCHRRRCAGGPARCGWASPAGRPCRVRARSGLPCPLARDGKPSVARRCKRRETHDRFSNPGTSAGGKSSKCPGASRRSPRPRAARSDVAEPSPSSTWVPLPLAPLRRGKRLDNTVSQQTSPALPCRDYFPSFGGAGCASLARSPDSLRILRDTAGRNAEVGGALTLEGVTAVHRGRPLVCVAPHRPPRRSTGR